MIAALLACCCFFLPDFSSLFSRSFSFSSILCIFRLQIGTIMVPYRYLDSIQHGGTMIKLNSDTFRRAIEKAQTVRPACTLIFTDETNFTFTVARSDGRPAIVDIWHEGGTLWTSCDCAAGVGLHRRGFPQPCYHVAQAALSIGLLPAALPVCAMLDPAPECAAARQVPLPLIDISELAPIPAPITAPATAPKFAAGVAATLHKAARLLGRVFWVTRKEARA
jgi:hypothetical protein